MTSEAERATRRSSSNKATSNTPLGEGARARTVPVTPSQTTTSPARLPAATVWAPAEMATPERIRTASESLERSRPVTASQMKTLVLLAVTTCARQGSLSARLCKPPLRYATDVTQSHRRSMLPALCGDRWPHRRRWRASRIRASAPICRRSIDPRCIELHQQSISAVCARFAPSNGRAVSIHHANFGFFPERNPQRKKHPCRSK